MNFMVLISSKCGQGWRGSKNPKNLWISLMEAPSCYLLASLADTRARRVGRMTLATHRPVHTIPAEFRINLHLMQGEEVEQRDRE